jgi:hypothetical protein
MPFRVSKMPTPLPRVSSFLAKAPTPWLSSGFFQFLHSARMKWDVEGAERRKTAVFDRPGNLDDGLFSRVGDENRPSRPRFVHRSIFSF